MQNFNTDSANQLVSIKNISSHYLYMSTLAHACYGWKSSEQCIGKTDYDLPCAAAKWADVFKAQDRKVFSTGIELLTLDIHQYKTGRRTLLNSKTLLKDSTSNEINLLIRSTDISQTILARYYQSLIKLDETKFLDKRSGGVSFILNSDHCPISLTIKQEECLFYLVRGKTIKEIARSLNLSPRTIEDHIERVKLKLNCSNNKELIEKSIDMGFLFYLPQSI